MSRIKDRTGILSTGVKVLSYAESKNGEAYWNCECPYCHQIWQVRGSHLNESNPISCCKKCSSLRNLTKIKKSFSKDITNQKFGKLLALKQIEKIGKTYLWLCKCDCGNYCEKELQYLMNGDTKSCGCLISNGERIIIKLLQENNILFEKEKNLFNQYRFDFYVNNYYIIEYDGKQHFLGSQWESLENIRAKDLEKNHFCFKNNIPIIRIPYNKNFTFNDLILETSNFILTEETENEYYRS